MKCSRCGKQTTLFNALGWRKLIWGSLPGSVQPVPAIYRPTTFDGETYYILCRECCEDEINNWKAFKTEYTMNIMET